MEVRVLGKKLTTGSFLLVSGNQQFDEFVAVSGDRFCVRIAEPHQFRVSEQRRQFIVLKLDGDLPNGRQHQDIAIKEQHAHGALCILQRNIDLGQI